MWTVVACNVSAFLRTPRDDQCQESLPKKRRREGILKAAVRDPTWIIRKRNSLHRLFL